MPRAMVGVTIGIYTAARLGLATCLTDDVERITGRAPIDFATFAIDERAAWARPQDGLAWEDRPEGGAPEDGAPGNGVARSRLRPLEPE